MEKNEVKDAAWSIDENGILKILRPENVEGKIVVSAVTTSETVYNDEGYENTRFVFEGVFNKPWTHDQEKDVKEIIIEEGITEIPFGAFSNFKSCTKVTIPNTVSSIGKLAFRACENLESIALPEGVVYIGEETFLSCSKLNNIVIPQSIKRIGESAFRHCRNLTQIELPEGLEYIGESAFEFCRGLKTITIPDSVDRIGRKAFYGCDSLRKAYVPREKIEEFKNAFEKPGYATDNEGITHALGTTVVAKRGESIFSKLFKKK